jgi:EAL domain-containing protein (putative c-di-GMP-specific phosphodiesterase class I)
VQQAVQTIVQGVANRKNRPLVWMILLIFALATQGMFSPLDDMLRALRNKAHPHAASGSLAIISIDDQTSVAHGEWPWPRRDVAALVRALDAAGVKRIAFEHIFMASDDAAGNAALAAALAALPERPILAAALDETRSKGSYRVVLPDAQLRAGADVAIKTLEADAFGLTWSINQAYQTPQGTFPSLAAALAGRHPARAPTYVIDYSIDADTIPQVSAADVLAGRAARHLAGKEVLVSSSQGNATLPGMGPTRPGIIQILAAETMTASPQRNFGWMGAFVLATILGSIIWTMRRAAALLALMMAALAFGAAPIWLDAQGFIGGFAPSIILILAVSIARLWRRYSRLGERTNVLSGLPNLLALREYSLMPEDVVVAVRIKNYTKLAAALSKQEHVLTQQIIQRLGASGMGPLFHGDEGIFCWIAHQGEATELAEHLEALHSLFLVPLTVDTLQVDISLAFGIDTARSTDAGIRFASALIAADEAAAAGMRWKYYDPTRLGEAEWQMSLLGQLDAAIESGEVWVAYQAKQDIRENRITGAEALARWAHPQRGAIPPDEFIPAAEANGRIDKLTYFVLDQALSLAAEMGPGFDVAVNLSAQMFDRRDFVDRVAEMCDRLGVSPGQLTLEVTESAAVQSEQDMLQTVTALLRLGVSVAIDDYGTGYSTLDYLKKIKATELKIDRSFVAAMERNRSDRLLVNATIKLAHSLGQVVVAEGVETKETLDMLRRMHCDKAQGYYISRPVPRSDFVRFMHQKSAQQAA